MTALAESGAAFMSIFASSPALLKGVKTERIANYQKAAGTALPNIENIFNLIK